MARVPDKKTAIRLYLEGAFGNRTRVWPLAEYLTEGAKDNSDVGDVAPVAIRSTGKDRLWIPGLDYTDVVIGAMLGGAWGANPRDLIVCEMAPTERTILNAEIMRTEAYLDLHYSRLRLPLRESLTQGPEYANGATAARILRDLMDGPSFDRLQYLWDVYPGSVVELSIYERTCGVLGLNTIFWEVRDF